MRPCRLNFLASSSPLDESIRWRTRDCSIHLQDGCLHSIIASHLRRGLAQFKLRADFLDLRGLLVELRTENFHFFLQLRDSRLLFLHWAVLF